MAMDLDQLPVWKRASVINLAVAAGLGIGMSSAGFAVPPKIYVPTAIFTFALLNALFFAVRPRVLAAKRAGSATTPLHVMKDAIRDHWVIIAVVALQLIGTSRTATTASNFVRWSAGRYVEQLPNAPFVAHRMILPATLMGIVSLIWLTGAVELWRGSRRGWWIAVVLNGLAAIVGDGVQLINPHQFLFDPASTTAIILLMLPTVRGWYGIKRTTPRTA